jgi:O-antigen biosynthesis protein
VSGDRTIDAAPLASARAARRPFDPALHYHVWRVRNMPTREALYRERVAADHVFRLRPRISVVTPLYETPPEALRRMLRSVADQTYARWEHCLVDDGSPSSSVARAVERARARDPRIRFRRRMANGGIVAATNDALALASGDFVAFLDHDDELDPRALYRVVEELNRAPETDVFYSDLDLIGPDGLRHQPLFFPGWSPELLLASPYVVHLAAYRRELVERLGRLRPGLDGAQDYDLALRAAAVTNHFRHVPGILYHWRQLPTSTSAAFEAKPYALPAGRRAIDDHLERLGRPAERVEGVFAGWHDVRFHVAGSERTSLVVALDGDLDADALERFAAGVAELCAEPGVFELLVAGPERALERVRVRAAPAAGIALRLVPVSDPEAGASAGAAAATGEHLAFLDADLEPVSTGWLRALLEYSQQKPIGAVGGKILAVDDSIEAAGFVLPRALPHGIFRGAHRSSVGYLLNLRFPTNVLAIGGGCLVTRREIYEKVGGLRPAGEAALPDLDFCLRLRDHGLRVVLNPRVELRRRSRRGSAACDPARAEAFRRRWGDGWSGDPYYNPSFSPDDGWFRLPPV